LSSRPERSEVEVLISRVSTLSSSLSQFQQ
jgi:hypothetical protein